MEKKEYRRNAGAMIYLVSCAVNGKTPNAEKLKSIDLEQLFEVCQEHILTACAAYALEAAGIHDQNFQQAKEKAVRKNILLDAERAKILNRLEQEHIWYMPLKGAILHSWYPRLGMRQMTDNDILYDDEARLRIKDIMLEMGFSCKEFGHGNDDAYIKEPVFNFEMHNALFTSAHIGNLYTYYRDVKQRLLKDGANEYGWHFSDEDFYLYMIAHEYKHFYTFGTGVRFLVDTFIFLRKTGKTLNWDYINAELKKLDMADFERRNRELANNLFERRKLTDDEKKLLNYYIFSGTFGNIENKVDNELKRCGQDSKLKYWLHRFFPSYDWIQYTVPWVKKSKLLIPAAWIYRIFRGIVVNHKKVETEFRYLNKKSKQTKKQKD